ncbi:SsrA-binding protein SmpB, partial [Bacillus cereus group sp. TH230-1LC]|nr:SsrA-binding protein SmpB [Bacillus cereus group sp. TH230-1LC]
ERYEAGMVLQGWEVKAVRSGKVQLTDGYVVIKNGELFLIGCLINPLKTASTHVNADAARTKKLLLHKDEIRRLVGKVEQKGYTLVPLNLHWKEGLVKCEIALAKGKAEHDKRDTIKEREGKREVERAMKSRHRSPSDALQHPRNHPINHPNPSFFQRLTAALHCTAA